MFDGFADALVWMLRLALIAGLAWGAWLCVGDLLPARPDRAFEREQFATFALLVLLAISTFGGFLNAG